MDIITKLPKTHPDSKLKTQLFKSEICDIELMNVWCCGNGEPADKLTLELLKGKFLILMPCPSAWAKYFLSRTKSDLSKTN